MLRTIQMDDPAIKSVQITLDDLNTLTELMFCINIDGEGNYFIYRENEDLVNEVNAILKKLS